MEHNLKKEIPRATILLLTYRDFDHIYKNIDSILAQTYGNIEIVIADDGSDSFPEDDIRKYLLEHKHPNITNIVILAGKTNVGTVRNLNNAIRHSTGDVYIPLSQDDDFFSDDVVERIMQRYIDKPFNVLVTSRYGVNKKGEFMRFWPHFKARKYIEKMDVRKMFRAYSESWFTGIASGSVMNISSKFIKDFGLFDEKYKLWEDGPFFHMCLLRGYKVETAYDIISIRYEQTDGVSNNPNEFMRNDIKLFLDTDFCIDRNKYGYMHRRFVSFYLRRTRCVNAIKTVLLYLYYLDVNVMRLFCSELLRNWEKYDNIWEKSIKKM